MKNNKKVLITGGCGFIGSNLAKSLINEGYDVIIYDNLSTGYKKNIIEYLDKITFIEADIKDYNTINKYIKEVNCVFHLAAMISVQESIEKPIKCFETNVNATLNIINQCIIHNIRFIFSSSAAVYGEDKTPIKTEKTNTIPISPYGISKLNIEQFCQIYNKESNFKFTCFRNFNIYGPKQDPNSKYAAVIPSFIQCILNNETITIFGDGTQTRDFIYVEDITNAYILAYKSNINGIFNLGCNQILNLKELTTLILNNSQKNVPINYKEKRKGDIKHSRASSDKFKKISNWEPKISLTNGIKKTLKYYISNK